VGWVFGPYGWEWAPDDAEVFVGGPVTFFDHELMKYGNAVSPFLQTPSYEAAHLAMQRPLEDRYDDRYIDQAPQERILPWDVGVAMIADLVAPFEPPPPPRPILPGYFVGWSQPPRPIDVIASFNPRSSKKEQARAVLYDYYHDDPLRYWSDNEAVKRCFGGEHPIQKEDHDPEQLIAAYENPHHSVWQCQGDKNTWKDMDVAVQQAIAHRTVLGPLPEPSYDTDPIVIYYYDNDRMKKITYPHACLQAALNPNQHYWWKDSKTGCVGDQSDVGKRLLLDGVHTFEAQSAAQIANERKKSKQQKAQDFRKDVDASKLTADQKKAYPDLATKLSDKDKDLQWGDEGSAYDKDVAGDMGNIAGTIMSIIGAILQVIPGIGTAIGAVLIVAGQVIVALVNAMDVAFQGGDFAAALGNLGSVLIQAAATGLKAGAGVDIPPDAVKALGATVNAIAADVSAGQRQKLDFAQLWAGVAKKASSYGKFGDDEAHAIKVMLGENTAGNVFIKGYEAGKLTDPPTIAAIAKIVQAMGALTDPKISNIFLLGAGMGYIAKQQAAGHGVVRSQGGPAHHAMRPLAHRRPAAAAATTPAAARTRTSGESSQSPEDLLLAFVHWQLKPRYGLNAVSVVGAQAYDQTVAKLQALLNELWGFQPGQGSYLRVDGVLGKQTKEMLRSFQQNYGVGPGDGTPSPDTVQMLEAEVSDKHAMQQRAGIMHASGEFDVFAGAEPEPDWGPLSRGCPAGMWWDSLSGVCRPVAPTTHTSGDWDDGEAVLVDGMAPA
jgi:hypothetical protein